MPYRKIGAAVSSSRCTVYLLHFTKPLGHAQHYIGMTKRDDVEERLQQHRSGRGATLCRYAVQAGAELLLARVWEDQSVHQEQRIKNRGGARRHCPICKATGG